MDSMSNHGSGWVRLQFTVPSRGLIGFRTALLSATRGTGIASSLSAGYAPWAGAIVTRQNGSMVSDRAGVATPYAMQRLQARGNFFVEPQSNVYEGSGRRHQQQAGRVGREHHAGQAHDQHAFLHRRRAGNADSADQDEP